MRPESFDLLAKRLERIANRIVLGVLAAAFIALLATLLSVCRVFAAMRQAQMVFSPAPHCCKDTLNRLKSDLYLEGGGIRFSLLLFHRSTMTGSDFTP